MLIKEIFSYIKNFPIIFKLFKWKSILFTFYAAEMRLNYRFWKSVDNRINNVILQGEEKEKFGGWIDKNVAVFIYAIIRIKKPLHSLETGVGGGLSSKVILKGIKKKQKGQTCELRSRKC